MQAFQSQKHRTFVNLLIINVSRADELAAPLARHVPSHLPGTTAGKEHPSPEVQPLGSHHRHPSIFGKPKAPAALAGVAARWVARWARRRHT